MRHNANEMGRPLGDVPYRQRRRMARKKARLARARSWGIGLQPSDGTTPAYGEKLWCPQVRREQSLEEREWEDLEVTRMNWARPGDRKSRDWRQGRNWVGPGIPSSAGVKVRDDRVEERRWRNWCDGLTRDERIAGLRGMLMHSWPPRMIKKIEARLAELEGRKPALRRKLIYSGPVEYDPWSLD